jgi:hypothetical protein
MNDYTTKTAETNNEKPSADLLQKSVDLRLIAAALWGVPSFESESACTYPNYFDPDGSDVHIMRDYWRNPLNGDRGGAIKFIQKHFRCSYAYAVGFLHGWLLACENPHLHNQNQQKEGC